MATSNPSQTLTAAFSFGILLQAASGALVAYFKSHGSTTYKDGRRLVLVLFLSFAALWAGVQFVDLLISKSSTGTCQTALIFSTAFDQLARVAVEQFLLWSIGQGKKVTTGTLILQTILGIRLIAGGVLVGFTRPEFAPACVAHTSLVPVGVVVLAFDIIISGVLIVRSLSLKVSDDPREPHAATDKEQRRALILIIVSFIGWTGTSVSMILGIPSVTFFLRTTMPSIGLLSLVSIITLLSGALLAPIEKATIPEAQSPFVTPSPPSREIFSENVDSGSPLSGHTFTKSGSLFVVNPSSTARDSPTIAFQGNNEAEPRGFSKLGGEPTANAMGLGGYDQPGTKKGPGYRGSSGVFPTILTTSLILDKGALAPHIKAPLSEDTPIIPVTTAPAAAPQPKKSLFGRSKPTPKPTVRSLGISQPVAIESDISSEQPFAKIQTIDLATAASNERERREIAAAKSRLVSSTAMSQPPLLPAQEAFRKSISVKRKEMPRRPARPTRPEEVLATVPASPASGLSAGGANGSSTSASLSPRREEVRRRSPRNANSFDQLIDEKVKPKPTFKRMQSIGLPSGPRATRIAIEQEPAKAEEPMVMFLNNIVYDNPAIVKTIISEAPELYASAKAGISSEKSPYLTSSGSIIHRPRPIRRDSETYRALFPSEPSPRHKRSKSGSSIANRKSLFINNPGSPSQLPQLPAPPTSASKLTRLLPNDTKSMTLDEKIQLLFPAPPGVTTLRNRRSSVPSLPRIPSVFMSETPPQSPSDGEKPSLRASKQTTMTFFGTPDPAMQAPKENTSKFAESQTYRLSPKTYRSISDQVGETWIPGIPSSEVNVGSLAPGEFVRDSHAEYEIRNASLNETSSSNAKSTFIQRGNTHKEGTTVFMKEKLDSEENSQSIVTSSGDTRQSFFLEADQALLEAPPAHGKSWHRRIGDDLPAFSERKSIRKAPLPTPLLLSRGRQATVVVRAREPSPVVDSPEKAIQEIQEQLKRFEEPDRGSMGSLLRHMPDATSSSDNAVNEAHSSRFRLLESLEKEVGQQESQWQQMQTNLDRDSISTILTTQPSTPLESALLPESSQTLSPTASRVASRRAAARNSMTLRSKGEHSARATSAQRSDNARASIWQQRLAEAQKEYLENAPVLPGNRNVNFLSVSKSHQLGSPTPPDSVGSETDLETDLESESEDEQLPKVVHKEMPILWEPEVVSPDGAAGRLWYPPREIIDRSPSSEPPAKNIRPSPRQIQHALPIFSSNLWSKPSLPENHRPVVGLWGSWLVRPKSIITRPVTQRPTRRSKRMTFLPDIVEDPVPLPNKRDTLGIFQFPWGETSDSAIYQPPFNPALLAGPLLNARLDARSRELEPDLAEYSSSFFDDYDDEDLDDDDDSQSDDEFDETTLWEIASLLKSEDIPSTNSLLPSRREISENSDDETEFEFDSEFAEVIFDGSESSGKVVQFTMTKLPIQPLAMTYKEKSQLWVSGRKSAVSTAANGLNQPDQSLWEAYIPSSDDIVRSKPRSSEYLPVLETRDLWTGSQSEIPSPTVAAMWNGNTASKQGVVKDTSKSIVPSLWILAAEIESAPTFGLFVQSSRRSDYRTSNLIPAAIDLIRKPRATQSPLSQLTSSELWSGLEELRYEQHWISVSSVRPESPSVCSESSSGRSSPVSDASSVTSASTDASSLWGSINSTSARAWWEAKARNSPNLLPNPLPVESSKFVSKLPLPQLQTTGLEPLKDSRGLALRDLLEVQPKKSLSRPVASPAEWDLALAKAISQGRPRLHRPSASPSDWAAALAEAVSKSNQRLQRPKVSPEMWEEALKEATGENTVRTIVNSPPYDPAIRHPVFFTESLVSAASDIHPAATGSVVKPRAVQTNHMWSIKTPIVSTGEESNTMWQSLSTTIVQSPTMFVNPHTDPWIHKRREPTSMTEIESWDMWGLSREIPQSPKNWLVKREISRVVFRY